MVGNPQDLEFVFRREEREIVMVAAITFEEEEEAII